MTPIHVSGMHGIGDNLHQRAVIRQLLDRYEVWLDTPWPCLYHDMPKLNVTSKGTTLRTQAKNIGREAHLFRNGCPSDALTLRVHYKPADVRSCGSVLGAMMKQTNTYLPLADFRLPVPASWRESAAALLAQWKPTKPVMILRPLVVRSEWGGNVPRNPDPDAYAQIYRSIRDRYFVVSVADLEPDMEWTIGPDLDADVKYHRGELSIETLAALTKSASLVFAAPGFAVILAQAVGTPIISIFGGYENSSSFSAGAKYAPYIGIDPVVPCQCFSHSHNCQKQIDITNALSRIERFLSENNKEGLST